MAQRQRNRLSPAFVRSTTKIGMHADGGGLYLQVMPAKDGGVAKSWIFRFGGGGRERKMGLGRMDDVTLSELDFGLFMQRERVHFPFGSRYGGEFLYCLGSAGT
jgi:hypothetical protein